MATHSLAQNVGEIPRYVPWNNKYKEFEGRRQNMMGLLMYGRRLLFTNTLLSSMTEKKILLYPSLRCITRKKVRKPAKIITNKETTVDPIRCLA